MRAFLLVLTLAALAAGCSHRDRANPLDPANPQTGGRPSGFVAIADYKLVRLSWNAQPSLAVDGFRLERLRAGDSLYRPLGELLPRGSSYFLDSGEPNGATVRYRLYYVIGGATSHLPAEDYATPGALRPWVTEFDGATLARLSPDARHVLLRIGNVGHVQGLAVSHATGNVWCSAGNEGVLSLHTPDGTTLGRFTGVLQPASIALTPLDESVWVGMGDGRVAHYQGDASGLASGSLSGLLSPQGVAIGPRDYSVWVCDQDGNRVVRYNAAGTWLGATTLAQPTGIVIDSVSNLAWVTSIPRGTLWRVNSSGAIIDSSTAAQSPTAVAVDYAHGRTWIADPWNERLVGLDPRTLDVVVTVPGLTGIQDVDVDRATGDAWVTLPGTGQVLRIDVAGNILERCAGLRYPVLVRLDPGLE